VKVWDAAVLALFDGLGNAAANDVWEEELPHSDAGGAAAAVERSFAEHHDSQAAMVLRYGILGRPWSPHWTARIAWWPGSIGHPES
jgi:hypothetical protein